VERVSPTDLISIVSNSRISRTDLSIVLNSIGNCWSFFRNIIKVKFVVQLAIDSMILFWAAWIVLLVEWSSSWDFETSWLASSTNRKRQRMMWRKMSERCRSCTRRLGVWSRCSVQMPTTLLRYSLRSVCHHSFFQLSVFLFWVWWFSDHYTAGYCSCWFCLSVW